MFNRIDVSNVSYKLKVKHLKGKIRETNFEICKEKSEFGGIDERRETRRTDNNRQHAVCLARYQASHTRLPRHWNELMQTACHVTAMAQSAQAWSLHTPTAEGV